MISQSFSDERIALGGQRGRQSRRKTNGDIRFSHLEALSLLGDCETHIVPIENLSICFMLNDSYDKGSSYRSFGQSNASYAGLSSSVLVHWPSVFAPSVAARLLLSILQLFYEQLPFSSSTFLPSLIASSLFSPEQEQSLQLQVR